MCDGLHPTIKVVDGVSEGKVGLDLHMKHCRKKMGTQEEITDDDVFQELINIVMDVFSTKSEKCMLTFELPVESGVLKEISSEQLTMENGSDVSSKSDILIPLKGSKYSRKSLNRRKRKMKMPIAKTSKYKLKKKIKKRLNPIVQTALHPKPGFTDLESLFWMHQKQSHCITKRECDGRSERVTGSSRNMVSGWRDSPERDALLNEVSDLRDITTDPSQGSTYIDTFRNLRSEFKDVLETLEGLARPQEWKISFGKLSYHLEGIQRHIEAIRNSLRGSQSSESIITMPQLTSTEGSEAPKRKNKVGVRLIRIGAKMSRKSSMHMAPRSKKRQKRKNYKFKSGRDAGLDEILKNYQRVKKEETEIVQVLLGKLGFHKDRSNHKCRKRYLKRHKHELCGSEDNETVPACSETTEKIHCREVSQNTGDVQEDLHEYTNPEMLKAPQSNMTGIMKPKKLVQMPFLENKKKNKDRNKGNRKHTPRKYQKRREPREKLRDIISKRLGNHGEIKDANLKNHSQTILNEHPSPVFSKRSEEIMKHSRKEKIKNAGVFTDMQSCISSKEDRMMRRIQSAAKRLEYMHSVVDKKLNHLSKQQKELNRKITGKPLGDNTPRESQSNEDSQNDGRELPKGSSLNLSTEVQEWIFQPYKNFKFEESDNLSEILKFNVNEPKEASKDGKLVENSLHRLESQGSVNEGQFLCGSNQNYVCNYMMELCGKESELAATGFMANQHGSEHSGIGKVFSSAVLTNEYQEDSSSIGYDKDPPATSILSATTKENEGEIIEESIFASPRSYNKNAQKLTARKKKKRVIHTPSCALS